MAGHQANTSELMTPRFVAMYPLLLDCAVTPLLYKRLNIESGLFWCWNEGLKSHQLFFLFSSRFNFKACFSLVKYWCCLLALPQLITVYNEVCPSFFFFFKCVGCLTYKLCSQWHHSPLYPSWIAFQPPPLWVPVFIAHQVNNFAHQQMCTQRRALQYFQVKTLIMKY